MELELTFVTAKLSLSKFALSSSLARTPVEDALFAFIEAFSIDESVVNSKLEYESIEEWDSIGHMGIYAY